ncbi:MAG: UMP kinase [Gammaproteobacteria bacterium]|nr:UMP kinase [Gammaproteobacteria bacterium]MCP5135312.1 UMP kinase [Gammaproteobacteria bacterium]
MSKPIYKRILLKLSGEALMGDGDFGIDPGFLGQVAGEVAGLVKSGVQVGMVIGGGNIFRGAGLAGAGMDRVVGDQMGMLATVMNALAMGQALEAIGCEARVMSAIPMNPIGEGYSAAEAKRHLSAGRVALFAAGTGNPYFTTDSAAALRAIEIGADVLFKATKVDGVYTADPAKDPSATRYTQVSFAESIEKKLGVMDQTAFVLCRDHSMPIRVFSIFNAGDLGRAVNGEDVGTIVQ